MIITKYLNCITSVNNYGFSGQYVFVSFVAMQYLSDINFELYWITINRTRIVTWYNLCSILRARLIFLKGVHRAYFCKSSAPFYTKSGARVVECSTEPNMAVVMIRNLTNDFEK